MQISKFVESYFDAWNHGDAKGVADHLTKDGIYLDIPVNAQSTHDDLIDYLNDFFVSNRHRYELIGDILTNGNTVAFQYKSTLADPIEKSELPETYCGAEFMTLHGEAAVTITDYYEVGDRIRNTDISDVGSAGAPPNKYAKSGLCEALLHDYKRKLEYIMRNDQLYLRSDLTLPKLAAEVGCSVNQSEGKRLSRALIHLPADCNALNARANQREKPSGKIEPVVTNAERGIRIVLLR